MNEMNFNYECLAICGQDISNVQPSALPTQNTPHKLHNHIDLWTGRGERGERCGGLPWTFDSIIDDCVEAFDGFRFDCECELIWLASENGD